MIDRQTSIALLREELEQQRTRAEAAEAELRELRREMEFLSELHRAVGEWASADEECRFQGAARTARLLEAENKMFEMVEAHAWGEPSMLRRVVDAWKAAEHDRMNAENAPTQAMRPGRETPLERFSRLLAAEREALEALRHA